MGLQSFERHYRWADSGGGEDGEFAYTSPLGQRQGWTTGLRYVQLDLGAAYSVDRLRVWHYVAACPDAGRNGRTHHDTKTQVPPRRCSGVSADGNTWETVFDSAVSGEYVETAQGKIHSFTARPVRFVRDYLDGNTKNAGNHWVEIEVLGTRTTAYPGEHYEHVASGARQWVAESGLGTSYYSIGGSRVAMRRGGTVSYLLADHLGSTHLTLDSSGNKASELRYKAYGETRFNGLPGGTPTDRQFTGQLWEPGVGLYQMGARWYDPYLARVRSVRSKPIGIGNRGMSGKEMRAL